MAGWEAARVVLSVITIMTQLAIVPMFVMAQLEPAPAPTLGGPPLPPPSPPSPAQLSPPSPAQPPPPPGVRPPPAAPPRAVAGADEGCSKLNVGAIVGGVVGGLLLIILVILAVLWCCLLMIRAKKRAQFANGDKTRVPTPPTDGDKTHLPTHAPLNAPSVPARTTLQPNPDVQVLNEKVPVRVAAPLMVNRWPDAAPQQDVAYNMDVRRYSYEEVVAISNNWEYKLGEGGFGAVYYGEFFSNSASGELANAEPQRVALKRLSTSQQGKNAFLNEVRLLSKIHYWYLVSLVGFCDEINNQVLIYEYVQEGSLASWLHGNNRGHPDFNWYYRLLIALHAALGLEYLHVGARPNIVHRDVKSSNILITKEWEGRVADFGLSKTGIVSEDQQRTHMTTVVKGTPGYLDPEYIRTSKLTTKSDVYSFGIVLLELVTGRLPIDPSQEDPPEMRCIEIYVQSHYPRNLATIADPNLKGNYDMRSMQKLVNVSLRCVALQGDNRPTMSDVVGGIRSAMKLMEGGQSSDTEDFLNEVVAEINSKTPRSGPSKNKHHRRSSTGAGPSSSSASKSNGSSPAM